MLDGDMKLYFEYIWCSKSSLFSYFLGHPVFAVVAQTVHCFMAYCYFSEHSVPLIAEKAVLECVKFPPQHRMINALNTMTIPLDYAVQQVMIRRGIPEANRHRVRQAIDSILTQFPERRLYIDDISGLLPSDIQEKPADSD